jgi:photosynthetic reaction center cytochrome c subunit
MNARTIGITLGLAGATLLAGCEPGRKVSEQTGYRGTGMAQVVDVSSVKAATAIPQPPYPLPPEGGPTAAQTYQNVQVLGGLSAERFNHLMAMITQWVAPPEQGCNYCHNPANMASDEVYQKVVARRMIQMTQTINSRWASHVQETGVTCYTCHRGQGVPANVWARSMNQMNTDRIRGNKRGQNTPDPNVGYASLPTGPFEQYLEGNYRARVAGKSSYPPSETGGPPGKSIKEAESVYAIMMHQSTALGVNCTYCHNTQSLGAWNLSRGQRATAYYGLRMVNEVNDGYITPLAAVFPANRKGPHGDPYKVNCTTCHQGVNKPLGGRSMVAQAPVLWGPRGAVAQGPVEGGAAGQAVTKEQFRNPGAVNQGPASGNVEAGPVGNASGAPVTK